MEGYLTAVFMDDGRPLDLLVESVSKAATGSVETRPLGVYFVRTLVDGASYCRINGHNQMTLVLKVGERDVASAGR